MPHISEKNVLWKEKNGIITVLQLSSGNFFELNAVGSFVWKGLAEGKNADAIIHDMALVYDAPREQITRDVQDFIRKMTAAGLLAA